MLLSVTDGEGKVVESHTYDTQMRASTSQRAYGADSVTLDYSTSGQTTLSDSMSRTTTYGYQSIYGRNFPTGVAGSGCASCGGRGNSAFTYDVRGNLLDLYRRPQ